MKRKSSVPRSGKVYGDPTDPQGWRLVVDVDGSRLVEFKTFDDCDYETLSDWVSWVNDIGAVLIGGKVGSAR